MRNLNGSRRVSLVFALIAACACLAPAMSLARIGEQPVSLSTPVIEDAFVVTLTMPVVDHQMALLQDQVQMNSGEEKPLRFAVPQQANLSAASSGTWETLPSGDRLWRLRIISDGAYTLNFGFTTFDLPGGAVVWFYPADRSSYDGPYDAADAAGGEFWSAVIPGDDVVIEMLVPADAPREPRLLLASVNHDYRGFGGLAARVIDQGACNNDVICPEAAPWANDIQSAGVYTLSGSWTCSGQMLNTVGATKPPYFLTAYHCGISTANDQTVRVYWNFESPTCGALCCGSLAQTQLGSDLRAKWSTSDFCLIQLFTNPQPEFNVYYAGWDARKTAVPSVGVGIHHPNCDEKAISWNNNPLIITSYLGTATPGNGTHWRVDRWEDGTTEPGSSGSGIWDQNHHLVGQLHGGYASCSSLTSDWYGCFTRSWVGGGTAATRLRTWLDPGLTGAQVLDGTYVVLASDAGAPSPAGASLAGTRSDRTPMGARLSLSPNPAAGRVDFAVQLPQSGMVSFIIHDVTGRVVSRVPTSAWESGARQIEWSALTAGGDPLPAGIYFVQMSVDGNVTATEKLLLVR